MNIFTFFSRQTTGRLYILITNSAQNRSMDHLSRLREAFNPKPLDFQFGPDDPLYFKLEKFHKAQLQELHDMKSLIPRTEGAPSDTYLHSMRVAQDVYAFALYIGLPSYMAENLRWAVALHDIGKIELWELHDKPGRYTDEEFKEMQRHTEYGVNRIKSLGIEHPLLKLAEEIAQYHHERNDGKGYYRLKETQIPYFVRLVQLCDNYDAVSAPRIYRTDKEQLTPYETMKNMLDPHGFLYGAVDQRFAIPFCLLKVNMLEGDLSQEHHKMLEHYLLDPVPFSDEDFWPSPDKVRIVD